MDPEKKVLESFDLTTRELTVRADTIDKENRSVEAIFSTEKPVTIFDYNEWRLIDEVLISRGFRSGESVVMLDSHMRFGGVKTIMGSGREVRAENGDVIGRLFFADSEGADEAWKLVEQKHLRDVSVGYIARKFVDIPAGQVQNIDGKTYDNTNSNRVLRITQEWDLKEISLVPIGANDQAKIREMLNHNQKAEQLIDKNDERKTQKIEVITMEEEKKGLTEEQVKQREEKALSIERKRVEEIMATAEKLGMVAEGQKAIRDGMSVAQFNQEIINKRIDGQQTIDTRSDDLGLTDKEIKEYSMLRAIQAILLGKREHASFEMKISDELSKRYDKEPNGFFVPNDVIVNKRNYVTQEMQQKAMMGRYAPEIQQRILTVAAAAANLVGTDHLGASFIDLLRNKAKMLSLGVRMLTGLRGNVSIPKQTGASTAYWLETESTALTLTDMTFGALALSPKTVAAGTSFSRQLLLQSDPSIQALVMDDLVRVLALAIDLAIIDGSGASGQPTGILNTTGIGAVDGVNLDWDKVVEFETDVEAANADVDTMNFVTRATVKGLMKKRHEFEGGIDRLWTKDNMVNGYPGIVSNQVPANTAIFGAFSQFLVGMWGVLDVYIDPATLASTAGVVIRAFQSLDLGARQATAFSASENIS